MYNIRQETWSALFPECQYVPYGRTQKAKNSLLLHLVLKVVFTFTFSVYIILQKHEAMIPLVRINESKVPVKD